jgi:ParB-like chromosome segregation protein Spo0J
MKFSDELVWVEGSSLKAAPWRATYILAPDLEVLSRSMDEYGWLQPIVVQKKTNMIIDGHYRWEIAGSSKTLRSKNRGMVPVIFEDCGDLEAMVMHLRLNRSKGATVAKRMSRIFRDVIRSGRYSESDMKHVLAMKNDEIDLMIDGTLIKNRKIAEHKYSKAWVPVEAPASITETAATIERPPNPDR